MSCEDKYVLGAPVLVASDHESGSPLIIRGLIVDVLGSGPMRIEKDFEADDRLRECFKTR